MGSVMSERSDVFVKVNGHVLSSKLRFLIDSGASHNFIGAKLLSRLGIVPHVEQPVKVRMANQHVVNTSTFVHMLVKFSADISALLRFTVLPVDCPTILGMPFLHKLNPVIDWQARTVCFSAAHGAQQVCLNNTFDDLPVDDVVDAHVAKSTHGDVELQSSCITRPATRVRMGHDRSGTIVDVQGDDVQLSIVQFIRALPDDVIDECVQVGGIEHCVDGLQRANAAKTRVSRVYCPFCKIPHFGDVIDGNGQHVCKNTLCAKKFTLGDTCVHANPLADHFALTMRVIRDESSDHVQSSSGQLHGVSQSRRGRKRVTFDSTRDFGKSSPVVAHGNCGGARGAYLGNHGVAQGDFGNAPGAAGHCHQRAAHAISDHCDCQQPVQARSRCNFEQVSLQSFKRDLKRGKFQEVFWCCSKQIVDSQHLNFTHRSAYGTWGEGDVASNEQLAKDMVDELKTTYPVVFSEPDFPVQRPLSQQHKIDLVVDAKDPPRKKLYPLDQEELTELKSQIDKLLASGRITHSSSPYGAPILFAKKKDGGLRMCIDYRALNAQTVLDRYPLPRIDDLLQRLGGSKIFSKLDIRDAYHQIPMFQPDMQKTAFVTRYGQFEFTVMPFGLCNAPATFQRVMNQMMFDLLDKCVLVYLDDILIYSRTIAQHKEDLHSVFKLLQKFNFRLKESKCALFLESVEFLGFKINTSGICVERGKVDAVRDWVAPTTVNEVQQFLGLANYYRRFVKDFATIAEPLTRLTRKDVKFEWSDDQQRAFESLKNALCSTPTLQIFDREAETRLCCDASGTCIGAVLEQKDAQGLWHPVEYYSKRLNDAQSRYSATERELLAIIMALERWRQFLIGVEFVVFTDHVSLTYLQSQSRLSRRQARWLDILQQFKFKLEYVPGKLNRVADALSRPPEAVQQLQSVITLNDDSLLFKTLQKRQAAATDDVWFQYIVEQAKHNQVLYSYRMGVLCRLIGDYYAPVIPPSDNELIEVILSELHSSALGGHLAFKKMLALCKKRFYWKNLRRHVYQFCKTCATCQMSRTSTQKPVGLLQPHDVPQKPFQVVSLDFVTGLPKTDRGFDSILTIVDRFSKYVCLVPCSADVDATSCARLFFDHWVTKFGLPTKLISDRDVRFTSSFWGSLMKCLNCKLNMSSSFHPQTDGQTERFNRSLEQVLRSYVSPGQSDWDLLLAQVAFALNNSAHAGTRVSPFECIFGFQLTLPLDTALSQLQDVKNQSTIDFVQARNSVQQQVRRYLGQYTQQMQRQANKGRRHVDFSVGDYVYLNTANLSLPRGLSKKLAQKWIGPYQIVKQISTVSFQLQLPQELGRLHNVFHVSLLKHHVGDLPQKRDIVFVAPDEQEFEVDKLLQKRFYRNRVEYLVLWKGYPVHEATWEPLDHLQNASKAVERFEKQGVRTRKRVQA